MRFRLTGTIRNHDAAAHECYVQVDGLRKYRDHGVSLPTRLHLHLKQLGAPTVRKEDSPRQEYEWTDFPQLHAGKSVEVDETFEMDAVTLVQLPRAFADYLEFSFELQIVE